MDRAISATAAVSVAAAVIQTTTASSSANNQTVNPGTPPDHAGNTAREAVGGGDGTSSGSASGPNVSAAASATDPVPVDDRAVIVDLSEQVTGQPDEQVRRGMQIYTDQLLSQLRDTRLGMQVQGDLKSVTASAAQNLLDAGSNLNTALEDELDGLDPSLTKYLALLSIFMDDKDEENFRKQLSNFSKSMRQGSSAAAAVPTAAASETATAPAAEGADASASTSTAGSTATSVSVSVSISASVSVSSVTDQILSGKINFSEGMRLISAQLNITQQCDPLVLDINGDGIDLSGAADGVNYDIRGTGETVRTGFVRGDDALLFLDQNGNNMADNGRELFGDQEGDANGFAELAQYDENADGQIDELDAAYTKLRLWQDKNADGVSQEDEVSSLYEMGLRSISLAYQNVHEDDGKGNTLAQRGSFTRNDGTTGVVADALLGYL